MKKSTTLDHRFFTGEISEGVMTMMIYNRHVSSRRPLRLSIRIRIREIRWYGVILGTEESVERFFGEREREEDERSSKQPSNRFVGLNRLKKG